MENASKALLMAGGILIGLLIIGSLYLMISQLGDYQYTVSSEKKDQQLIAFNQDFERYADEDTINGVDIISIINKVRNYNKKAENGGVSNSVDYSIKMEVHITNIAAFREKNVIKRGNLKFPNTIDITEGSNTAFETAMKSYMAYENKYTIGVLNVLATNYDELNAISGYSDYRRRCYELTGTNVYVPKDELKDYTAYSEFKLATFRATKTPEYSNGQIQKLYFQFVK